MDAECRWIKTRGIRVAKSAAWQGRISRRRHPNRNTRLPKKQPEYRAPECLEVSLVINLRRPK